MIKVVVFDFDGVIIDSNKTKADAYVALFADASPEILSVVKKYAADSYKNTRFGVFRNIFSDLGMVGDELENSVAIYAEKYGKMVEQSVGGFAVSVKTTKTLEELSGNYSLYINSGTYENTLLRLVSDLKISSFFKGVFGCVDAGVQIIDVKVENLKRIGARENVTPSKMVMVGDGEADRDSAKIFGCHFIGVANQFNNWANENFCLIKNVSEVNKYLNVLDCDYNLNVFLNLLA